MCASVIVLILFATIQCVRNTTDTTFRFVVANDRLFAIQGGSSYGTEAAVYTTDDGGRTWREFDAPAKTLTLGGNGNVLLSLTSRNEVWRLSSDNSEWERLASLPGTHHYSILVDNSGDFLIGGINELTWHDQSGELLRKFAVNRPRDEHILFGDATFVDDAQDRVLVQANPFSVYLLTIASGEMELWTSELSPVLSEYSGTDRVQRFGKGYLVAGYDGVYVADGLNKPSQKIHEFRRVGNLNDEFCRDIASGSEADQWLLATNEGIRLFRGTQLVRTVFSDSNGDLPNQDDHDLILQVVPFDGAYFVSFARLKNRAIGVRLSGDVERWEAMRLPTTE
jgi:hypothetical protein